MCSLGYSLHLRYAVTWGCRATITVRPACCATSASPAGVLPRETCSEQSDSWFPLLPTGWLWLNILSNVTGRIKPRTHRCIKNECNSKSPTIAQLNGMSIRNHETNFQNHSVVFQNYAHPSNKSYEKVGVRTYRKQKNAPGEAPVEQPRPS